MRIFAIVLVISTLLALLFLAGCGSGSSGSQELSKEKYDQISNGMTVDKVKSIAGEPSRTETSTMSGGHQMGGVMMTSDMTVEYWYFQGSRGWVRLTVTNGSVTAKSGY